MTTIKAYAPLSEEDGLRAFLKQHGKYVRTEQQHSLWFAPGGGLVVEQRDGYTDILYRSQGDVGEVVQIRARQSDFHAAQELLHKLGLPTLCEWKMTRELYDSWPLLFYLERYEDFGVIVEAKLYAQLKDKQAAIDEAKAVLSEMGLEPISDEDLRALQAEHLQKNTTNTPP